MIHLDRIFTERVVQALQGKLSEADKFAVTEQLKSLIACDIDKIKSKNGHHLPSLTSTHKKNEKQIISIYNHFVPDDSM